MADTRYILSSNTPSTVTMSGTYTFHNGVMTIPSGSTLPEATVDAQLYWVPPSGALCIASGTSWVVFTLS